MQKKILHSIEKVKINNIPVEAKIDTGSDLCAICYSLLEKCHLESTKKAVSIRSTHGIKKRKMVRGILELKGKKFNTEFSVSNRKKMDYKVLIGKNILKNNFVIDVS